MNLKRQIGLVLDLDISNIKYLILKAKISLGYIYNEFALSYCYRKITETRYTAWFSIDITYCSLVL